MTQFAIESWIWYGFTLLVIALRFVARLELVKSVKHLQAEDYLMFLVLCFYTGLAVTLNLIEHAETNLMRPDTTQGLTPESIQDRIYGSKLVLVTEQCMLATIWGCKGCVLFLYARLTEGIKQQLAVKVLAVYVIIAYLVLETLYFGVWCRPFSNYWAVPTPNDQCSTAMNHLILTMAFNVSSDVLMICIPLPLLIRASLPLRSKLTLIGVFSMGTFIILCATLSKVSSFKDPFSPQWLFWYVREASTAICVANIPNCWTLVRRVFNLRSWTGGTHYQHNSPGRSERHTGTQKNGSTSVTGSAARHTNSLEQILRSNSQRNQEVPLQIWHQTSVSVREERTGQYRRDYSNHVAINAF
ncbi:hypothetical protein BDV25DRAFT_136198 [Aspergillus avenaceus]|uniref:Rhodopsin domain-containing protein n=1 Tax=Aspergillus avenaceus TaxID=36643 RepID=A0A5N6U5Y2_ASPAV|nr:hypothetical protein BDV25DRAFT_136198 [Aspergillus avenaceus]